MKQKDNKPGITKVKWEKVDKEWYEEILRENISSIKHKLVTGDIPIGENILKICEIMKSAAITSSSNKAIFKAKPKLKVWKTKLKQLSQTQDKNIKFGEIMEKHQKLKTYTYKRKRRQKGI
jgi:hypothetical protein